jgi:hypothetical protein
VHPSFQLRKAQQEAPALLWLILLLIAAHSDPVAFQQVINMLAVLTLVLYRRE